MIGTGNMVTEFTSEEICSILESCQKFGVKDIVAAPQELRATFFSAHELQGTFNAWSSKPADTQPIYYERRGTPLENEVEDEGATDLSDELRKYELMANDPMTFEQEMINQQLEREDDYA